MSIFMTEVYKFPMHEFKKKFRIFFIVLFYSTYVCDSLITKYGIAERIFHIIRQFMRLPNATHRVCGGAHL